MELHILASGSTGNAILVKMGNRKILVDAGISCRRIERGLADVGMHASDLDGVLITHEHVDHIKGVQVMAKKHRLPIFARPGVWDALPERDNIPPECRHDMGDQIDIGAVKVMPFPISHDAVDPVGYSFFYKNYKWTVVTDLGIVTRSVVEALAYSDVAVLESNHDVEMLQTGPYPVFLKQRVRGRRGHLSNHDAGILLARTPRSRNMQVFLAHLSQQNNHPQLAEQTVTNLLLDNGCAVGEDIILHRTYPDRIASLVK